MDCSTSGFPVLHSLPVQFSPSVVSDSLRPLGLPRVCSNSCPVMLSNHLILCHPLLLLPSVFPSIRVFSSEAALGIRWPKYWSLNFSISPSNEYSGLISFRIDWFDILAVQRTQESSPAPHLESISYLMFSLLYGPTLGLGN